MFPQLPPGPDGSSASESSGWVDAEKWSSRSRRLGPLRYSDLGRRRLSPPGQETDLARWLAPTIDRWWSAAGRPDPFTLVVVSGDDGRLAATTMALQPQCQPALRYVLVDPDHGDAGVPPVAMLARLPLENPAFLYPSAAPDEQDDPDEAERAPAPGIGPLFTLLGEVPGLGDSAGATVAVDVLSRLAYDVYVLDDLGNWWEARLAGTEGPLAEVMVPLDRPPAGRRGREPWPPGRFVQWSGAVDWLRSVLVANSSGALAVIEADPPVAQLAALRRPVGRPEAIEGTNLSVLEWRLG